MKRYYFKDGFIEADNLTAAEIKGKEKTLGKLVGVTIDQKGYVPVANDELITIDYKGETHSFKEWAEITGINERTLRARYRKGERGLVLFRAVGM